MYKPNLKDLFTGGGWLIALLMFIANFLGYDLVPQESADPQGIVSTEIVKSFPAGKDCLFEVTISGEVEASREGKVIAPQGLPDGYTYLDFDPWKYDNKVVIVEGNFGGAKELFKAARLKIPPPGERTLGTWMVGPDFTIARYQCKKHPKEEPQKPADEKQGS